MKSTDLEISSIWVKRLSYLFLILPFLIFCSGFLKPYISVPILFIFFWLVIKDWRRKTQENQPFIVSRRILVFTLLAVLLWVVLSGIGGFAFQNTDFHIRNSIFHDLINYTWPVKYHFNPANLAEEYGLTYYIGYWLPAAIIGKLFGWNAANIALYLWTVIGILLVCLVLFSSRKSHPLYFIGVLILFSGMDSLGTLITEIAVLPAKIPHPLWPPIMHLEWWASQYQFSSFTTQLFWVFNQAVPVWLCMALLWTMNDRRSIVLVWGLCVFFAPLPSLGMLPYVIIKILRESLHPNEPGINQPVSLLKSWAHRTWQDIYTVASAKNILGGGVILLISFLYYSANVNSVVQTSPSRSIVVWILYPIFIFFEGLLLWTVFRRDHKKDPNWYLAGSLILLIPLIRVGDAQDFCMRASIPTLFLLMVWSAEMLSQPRSQARTVLIVLLCIGAITPIYEINRSVYRTANYYINPPSQAERLLGQQVRIYNVVPDEFDHPFTLTADSFKSLANFNPGMITNFVAETSDSAFYRYLAK